MWVCAGLAQVMGEQWVRGIPGVRGGDCHPSSQERLAIFRSLHPHGGDWCLLRLTCFALIPLLAASTVLFVGLLDDLFNLTELPLAAKHASG